MKTHLKVRKMVLIAAILCFGISSAWGADLYVDAAAENGDGSSWSTAYTDLQDALAASAGGDTIHVAKGTYVPGESPDATFRITQNLTLLGGYPSGGGDRDPEANPTFLSGEIGTVTDITDNIHHVVNIYGYDFAVTLDGFTIRRGYASEAPYNMGGGMWVSGSCRITLRNITFFGNCAVGGGGGLRFSGESLTLSQVLFYGNKATEGNGGGILFMGGNLIMEQVVLGRNMAHSQGGGLYFSDGNGMDMNDVKFYNNAAVALPEKPIASGGGVFINLYENLYPLKMNNVTLSGNQAIGIGGGWGGGIYMGRGPDYEKITLTNVTLSGNQASGNRAYGGGICLYTAQWRIMELTNVTLSGNQANGIESGLGGGIFFIPQGFLNMFNVTMSGNIAAGQESSGGGVFAVPSIEGHGSARTYFRNSIFWGNLPDQLQGAYPINCVVQGGYASGYGNIAEDPMLGTLGNYGGSTQTIPLLEGSSAIDAAEYGCTVDTDQRGELRPQGAGCDIGAYEASVNLAGILIDPSGPVPVNTEISAESVFTGALSDTNSYSATWDWGDGITSDATIDKGNGIVTGSHVYTDPGVYSVSLEVNEFNEGSGLTGLLKTAVYQYVVVYDPAAGFVTGGGWFNSQAGAYKDNPSMEGQATFGFVSRYKKGADVPTGNTAFEFATGGLYFHSISYEWLVVTGSDYAKFKGSGTINGWGDFKFMVWAGDGAPDTFRIRIWDEVEDTGEEIVIYDNGSDQAINGGSIVIHAK